MQERLYKWSTRNYQLLLVLLSFALATTGVKPNLVIHGCIEHLLLDRLICRTYCVELPKPVDNRFLLPVFKISLICLFSLLLDSLRCD